MASPDATLLLRRMAALEPAGQTTITPPDYEEHEIASSPLHYHAGSTYVPPRYEIREHKISRELAHQIIKDELMLDSNPRLNLASYVTTWMEPECDALISDSLNKNYNEWNQYPIATDIQDRCVNMIARLFHAPLGKNEKAVGVSTVGSSEATMLAGLVFKRAWQNKRKAEGKPFDKPNIVTGANVHVCWKKFSCYFEVDLREVKLRKDSYVMDPARAVELVDESTICVCAILGSTYNGEFEDVQLLNHLLEKKNEETGWNIPIHVDAASGGFIAPFLYPELEWDFRLPLVKSINVSGHKYGLVYPGIGWALWRSPEDVPEELIFQINYLGAKQPTFALNFSKGTSQIIAQYYQLVRLGFEGYKSIMKNCEENAKSLRQGLEKLGRFDILSKDCGVPLVAFSLKDKSRFVETQISRHLRSYGWNLPAYSMAPEAQEVTLLRAVVRADFSRQLADSLVRDIEKTLQYLDESATVKEPDPKAGP